MDKHFDKLISFIVLAMFLTFAFQNSVYASPMQTNGSTITSMYGFLDYESGWTTKSSPSFYQSNTSSHIIKSKGKTSSSARGQLRLGFKFKNPDIATFGNIMADSWPGDFNLELAYVKHKIGKHILITIGKDWSLVNQRYFRYSSFVFKPYAAGFQGSKRTPQIAIRYKESFKNSSICFSVAGEYRNSKNGVIIGRNESKSGGLIASSSISSFASSIPAIAGQILFNFKTNFGQPSQIMAYYEIMPVYLESNSAEYRENAYLYSIASRLNIKKISLIWQYLHTLGMSGVAGVSGNSFKTFSYINENGYIIKRTSDTLGAETLIKPTEKFCFALGYTNLNFKNRNKDDDYFLKNEVKRVQTAFAACVINITKITKLFIGFDRIKTKYSTDNKDGGFALAYGSKLFVGYRMYF